jgi:hypothetical protein
MPSYDYSYNGIPPEVLAELEVEYRMQQEQERKKGQEIENWKHMISNWLGNPQPRAWPAFDSEELQDYRALIEALKPRPQPVPMPQSAPIFRGGGWK